MTVGNYVRHYSVRSGSGSLALECGAWCAVRGARCAVCGVRCVVGMCGAGLVHLSCGPRGPQPLGPLSISHVIPSRLFQILNSQRWNCNVLGRSRKMTVGNYVRHYSVRSGSGSLALECGAWCAVRGARCAVCGVRCVVGMCGAGLVHLSCGPRGPQPLGPLSISHVIPSRLFQILNSQRWNCNVLGRSRKMTAGNYVRHYSVRSGSGSPCAGAWCAVRGARCAVCDSWAG